MLKIVKHASQLFLDLGFVRPILWSCFKSRSYATQESGTISDCYSDERESCFSHLFQQVCPHVNKARNLSRVEKRCKYGKHGDFHFTSIEDDILILRKRHARIKCHPYNSNCLKELKRSRTFMSQSSIFGLSARFKTRNHTKQHKVRLVAAPNAFAQELIN